MLPCLLCLLKKLIWDWPLKGTGLTNHYVPFFRSSNISGSFAFDFQLLVLFVAVRVGL
jgi:hypothetical protein